MQLSGLDLVFRSRQLQSLTVLSIGGVLTGVRTSFARGFQARALVACDALVQRI
jgi:hypothetical protein